MMGAVLVFGGEEEPRRRLTTGDRRDSPPADDGDTGRATGDAAAGKALFASSGCVACHVFKPAGSTGKVGPDLDELKGSAAKAGQPLEHVHLDVDHRPERLRRARLQEGRDADLQRPHERRRSPTSSRSLSSGS